MSNIYIYFCATALYFILFIRFTDVVFPNLRMQILPAINASSGPPQKKQLRYFTSHLDMYGRLGNYIYAFMSTYGIARHLGRIPYVPHYRIGNLHYLTGIFPDTESIFKLLNSSTYNATLVQFGNDPHVCENWQKLQEFANSTYLAISGLYLQCWRYYHPYRSDVLSLLKFNAKIANESNKMSAIFKNDTNHKLCVHIRRDDFLRHATYTYSTEKFTLASVRFVRKQLSKRGINSSVVVFGTDGKWIDDLFRTEKHFLFYNVPPPTHPSVHLAFAAAHCKTTIITATSSTFGFWIGYLSNSQHVYYNLMRFRVMQIPNDTNVYIREMMLPNWIPLLHNESTNNIDIFHFDN